MMAAARGNCFVKKRQLLGKLQAVLLFKGAVCQMLQVDMSPVQSHHVPAAAAESVLKS